MCAFTEKITCDVVDSRKGDPYTDKGKNWWKRLKIHTSMKNDVLMEMNPRRFTCIAYFKILIESWKLS